MRNSPQKDLTLVLLASLLAGVVLDFICNGVLKIVWVLMYGPIYLVAAHIILLQLPRSKRWGRFAKHAAVGVLAGAFLGHVFAVGRGRTLIYTMRLDADPSKISLSSPDFPQKLIVESEKLKQAIPKFSSREKIPVSILLVSDYGCIRSWIVDTVGGVDVRVDREASWTWRTDKHGLEEDPQVGPGYEDAMYPWCRFKFY